MSEPYATWVYAVVPGSGPPPAPAVTGIAGEPVRLVEDTGVAAVVGSVPRAEVDEEPLRRHFRDPVWLERTARIHHRVVTTCSQVQPTVPFRLATVYLADDGVRELLSRRRDQFRAALETVTRRAEWGVQAYAGPAGPAPVAEPPPAAAAGPGTAYLLRQRAEREWREQARRRVGEAVRGVESSLAGLAVAIRPQPLPVAHGSRDQPGSLVLNMSYLVDDRARERFVAAAGRLAEQFPAIQLRVTGPWPAYSFVEIGEPAG
jgi:hypothetical protein